MNKTILEKRAHLVLCIIAAIMLFLALAPWPYGYYQLLRFVICGASIYVAFMAYNWHKIWATWLFGFIAVLFNPLIPIHLSRELWQPIDVVCALLFIIDAVAIKNPIQSSSDGFEK
ncbi:MAG: hypothetical protein JW749_12695 [Sedimentisphaerales bacterium]|nr:hypothetical protein [Sedimentisphaerales bacterium]